MINETTEIQLDESSRGKTWRMPVRDTSELKQIGAAATAFGAFACLFMIGWISGPLFIGAKMVFEEGHLFGLLFIGFSLLGFGGLVMALRLLIIGRKVIANKTRCSVTVRGNKLIATEEIGWFDWKRKCKIDRIKNFEIRRAGDHKRFKSSDSPAAFSKTLEDMTAVIATGDDKFEFFVVLGYSEQQCIELAEQISTEIGRSVSQANSLSEKRSESAFGAIKESGIASAMAAMDEGSKPTITVGKKLKKEEPKLPESTRLKLDVDSGHFACEVPASGLRGVAGFLCLFSTFWLLISGGIFTAALLEVVNEEPGALLFPVIFSGGFVAIGIALAVATVYTATVRSMLGLLGGQLFIRKNTIFGEKWHEFSESEITAIEVGPSGTEINDEPVMELKIHVKSDAKPTGVLSQLDDQELEWIAWRLRDELNLKSLDESDEDIGWQTELQRISETDGTEVDRKNEFRLPENSRIEIVPRHDSVEIEVPSQGILKAVAPTLFVSLFLGVPSAMLYYNPDEVFLWFFVTFAGIICFFVMTTSLIYNTRRFAIQCDAHNLKIDRRDLFFKKTFDWFRPDIEKIDIQYSGTKVNEKKHYQLSIIGSPNLKIMNGWSRHELAVVAAELNRVLKLNRKPL